MGKGRRKGGIGYSATVLWFVQGWNPGPAPPSHQGLDDSFEAVLAEEMAAMREAFEAQIAELNEQLLAQRTEHRRELRELREAHELELRAAEARGRNEK